MSDADPGAPSLAPNTEPRVVVELPPGKTSVGDVLMALPQLLAVAAVAITLPLLIWHGVPGLKDPEHLAEVIAAGIFGFISGKAMSKGGAQ